MSEVAEKMYEFTYSAKLAKDGKQYTKKYSFTERQLSMYLRHVFGWAVISYQAIDEVMG